MPRSATWFNRSCHTDVVCVCKCPMKLPGTTCTLHTPKTQTHKLKNRIQGKYTGKPHSANITLQTTIYKPQSGNRNLQSDGIYLRAAAAAAWVRRSTLRQPQRRATQETLAPGNHYQNHKRQAAALRLLAAATAGTDVRLQRGDAPAGLRLRLLRWPPDSDKNVGGSDAGSS